MKANKTERPTRKEIYTVKKYLAKTLGELEDEYILNVNEVYKRKILEDIKAITNIIKYL